MTQHKPWRRDLIAHLILEAIMADETERVRIANYVRERFAPIDAPVTDDELNDAAGYLVDLLEKTDRQEAKVERAPFAYGKDAANG